MSDLTLPADDTPEILEKTIGSEIAKLRGSTDLLINQEQQRLKVHLRQYASEPYIDRAVKLLDINPELIAFNSVWITRKYYPRPGDDTNSGNPADQAKEVAEKIEFTKANLGIEASPGFGLHPITWLDYSHWERRAQALHQFIVEGGFQGQEISLDIEGYGYVTDGRRIRTPPPKGEEHWKQLIEATVPIRHVLLANRMRATFYPAGGRKFDDYTRAALALGADRFGDEYCFVLAGKIRDGEILTRESIDFWREQLTNTDPQDRGVHYIPGLLTSNFERGIIDANIWQNFMGLKECWLFVDDKNYLISGESSY